MPDVSELPVPELLNPDRLLSEERTEMTLDEHRDRARALYGALHDTCDYARQLWLELQEVRRYLVASLPAPAPESGRLGGTRPTGPDDQQGWDAWIDAYAGITSALTGPHGNPTFGFEEARELARARLDFTADQQPDLETLTGSTEGSPALRQESAANGESESNDKSEPSAESEPRHEPAANGEGPVPSPVAAAQRPGWFGPLVVGTAAGWVVGRSRHSHRARN